MGGLHTLTVCRSFDGAELEAVMRSTPALTHIQCDIQEWIEDRKNICLRANKRDFGVFEAEYPGVYTGHYFFQEARGRKAIEVSQEMLQWMFKRYGAKVIRGLTPSDHKAALWMNRRLGFQHYGTTDTVAGPCEIFCLTAEQFEKGDTQ